MSGTPQKQHTTPAKLLWGHRSELHQLRSSRKGQTGTRSPFLWVLCVCRGEGELEGNVLEMLTWSCCFNAVLGPLAAAAFTGGICHNLAQNKSKCWCWVFSCCLCQGLLELVKVRSQERFAGRAALAGGGKGSWVMLCALWEPGRAQSCIL